MSAKNSGVSKEQYKQYAKEKGPQSLRVGLEVWRCEDKLPEIGEDDSTSNPCIVWPGATADLRPCVAVLERSWGGSFGWRSTTHRWDAGYGSWAYLPSFTTKEAT
jgi:hypothetical protein